MPDGREILVVSGPQHSKRLLRLDSGGASGPQWVPFAAEGAFALSASVSRRNQIVYSVSRAEAEMYRTEVTVEGTPQRTSEFVHSSFLDHLPEYSPNGSRVAFVSTRSGAQELWIAKADGSDSYPLTNFRGNPDITWPRWSPDGQRLVFTGNQAAYMIDLAGGAPALLIKEDLGARVCDWSRDGKWMYVASYRTGRSEIWKIPAKSGIDRSEDTQITKNGGGVPRLSSDGNFVYYVKGNASAELWRVPSKGGKEERVLREIANSGTFALSPLGIYFISRESDSRFSLMFAGTRTGRQHHVRRLDGHPLWGMTVSPDGRSILHVAATRNEGDLMLVDNYR
jgi:Tol biopolymer transport system component